MDFVNLKKQYLNNKNIINKSINKVLLSCNFIMGKEVSILENKLKNIVKSKYCLVVSSGTDALLLSLMSLNIKKNDEVIIPNFNYISSAEVVSLLGAKPILVDVNLENGLINEKLIQNKISNNTKAIIPTSLFGLMPNYLNIKKIIKKYKDITIIEDAAQSFGSSYKNIMSGNIAQISCTSFFPTKSLGCYGDGGAIFTNSKKIYNKILMLRSHGQKQKYNHLIVGTNSRMDTIQSAIVLSKLKIFNKEMKKRKFLYNKYINYFTKIFNNNEVKLFEIPKNSNINFSYFCIRVKNRDLLIKLLLKNKISYAIYYPKLISQQKAYFDKNITLSCNNGLILCSEIISLPINPYITDIEFTKITSTFNQFKKIKK